MKLFKRFMALALICTMISSLCAPVAFATGAEVVTYSATLEPSALNTSENEQTVVMTVMASKTIEVDAVSFIVKIPTGWSVAAIQNETLGYSTGDVNLVEGILAYTTSDMENRETQLIGKVTYTVPANTPANTYELGVYELIMSKDYGEEWESGATTSVNLEIKEKTHAWGEPEYDANNPDHVRPTCDTPGFAKYTCSGEGCNCGEVKEDIVPALGHTWGETAYNWSDDGSSCTATRTCGRDASHVETATAVVTSEQTKDPECEVKGETTYTATFTETWAVQQTLTLTDVSALTHTWGETAYNWVKAGDVWTCTATRTCGRDAAHVETATAVVTSDITTPEGCNTTGWTKYTATFTEDWAAEQTQTLNDRPATGAHNYVPGEYVWNADHTSCEVVGTCTCLTTATATTTNITSEQTKAPQCEVKGETTYTATFTETWAGTASDTVANIDETGHAWGEAEYNFAADGSSCTATRTCTNDVSHVETANAAITSEQTKAPECEVKGETTYTATFTETWAVQQTLTLANVSEIGHAWGAATYNFAADGSSCTATRVCGNNASHVETVDAAITSEIVKHESCSEDGSTKYTATFTVDWAETQIKTLNDRPATGEHNYVPGEYVWDGTAGCTVVGTCGCNATETANAVITSAQTKAPTCTEKGETTYTATFDKTWAVTQTKTLADVAELGHAYGAPTYEGDGKTAYTAKRVCANDAAHIELVNASITSEVTTEPTCAAEGVRTYTADFAEAWATDKVTTEPVEKLAHTYGPAVFVWAEDGQSATASITCTKCTDEAEGHVLSGAAAIEQISATTGDCMTKGTVTNKATITLNGTEYTDTKTFENVIGAHDWDEPTYTGDGKTSYTAQRVCKISGEHVENATAVITSKVTTEPTCTTEGVKTYTADFTELWAEDKVTTEAIAIAPDAHKWDAGVITTPATCSAEGVKTFTCQHNSEHTKTEVVPVDANTHNWDAGVVTTEPTCTAEGVKTYTCQHNAEHKKTESIDMLEHNYGSDNKCTVCGAQGPSNDEPTYGVEIDQPDNGKIKLSNRTAEAGEKVTITVTPDEGYELVELIVTDRKGNEIKLTQKGDNKFTFKMPAGKVEIEAIFEKIDADEETENPFGDVAEQDYYYDAVLWAVENGITNGMGEGVFAPGAVCNRAQVVTFLWRAAGCPEPKSNLSPFVDIAPDAYYYDAVLWAVENGITNGMSATEFAPNGTVTRGQTVTFLWRAERGNVAEGMNAFTDVEADAYYYSAVQWAVENGITNGMSNTTFAPANGCTRGQIVTFLYRTFAK